MKFVRWLGAYGKNGDLSQSGKWELSQVERQIAAEPLFRGGSLIPHAKIGLGIHSDSEFVCGWLRDAYTVTADFGHLKPQRRNKNNKKYKNINSFLKEWNKEKRTCHGEVIFSNVIYSAVVVDSKISERGLRRAHRLAKILNLPIRRLQK